MATVTKSGLTGEDLYNCTRAVYGGAVWTELDAIGKEIWREVEQLLSDRLAEQLDNPATPLDADRGRLRSYGT